MLIVFVTSVIDRPASCDLTDEDNKTGPPTLPVNICPFHLFVSTSVEGSLDEDEDKDEQTIKTLNSRNKIVIR